MPHAICCCRSNGRPALATWPFGYARRDAAHAPVMVQDISAATESAAC